MELVKGDVKDLVAELSRLISKSADIDERVVERSLRLLRPASSSSKQYGQAIKQTIRQSILAETSGDSIGPQIIADFEQSCENLRRTNSSLLIPFLSLLEPLIFSLGASDDFTTRVDPHNNHDEDHSATTGSTHQYQQQRNKDNDGNGNSSLGVSLASLNIDGSAMLPIVPPYQFSDVDSEAIEAGFVWVGKDVEIKLIRDLLYIFQGIAGRYIKFDPRSEVYVTDPSLRLRPPVRDTVLALCELGWLYTKVALYAQACEGPGATRGLVVQAFAFALQEELHDYYRLLAVLEQELARKTSERQSFLSGKNTSNGEGEDHLQARGTAGVYGTLNDEHKASTASGTSGLTLLRLRAWMQEPLERMCLMAKLVDAAGPFSGGALASRLHSYGRHGDPATRVLVQRIMDGVCAPLYSMVTRWVLNGELQDSYQEFFVGSKAAITPSGATAGVVTNMWLDMYYLRASMLPTFLTPALAEKALVIGKSINFIRLCLSKVQKSESKKNKKRATTSSTSISGSGLQRGMPKPSVSGALGYKVDDRASASTVDRGSATGASHRSSLEGASTGKDASAQHLKDSAMDIVDDPGDNDLSDGDEEEKSLGGRRKSSRLLLGMTTDKGADHHGGIDEGSDEEEDEEEGGALLGPQAYAEIEESLHALRYGSSSSDEAGGGGSDGDSGLRLSELVTRISVATDAKLLRIMKNKFHIGTHLLALKKFMLLGQGDFVTCLMDSVGPELKKRANQLYRHNLTGVLEGALRSSNAQFEPQNVLDRITVRLLEPSQGDTGWEIFSLDYIVDVPLNAVVHAEAISRYRMAFHMLWRLKRVEWSLFGSWKQFTSFSHIRGKEALPVLKPILHKCSLSRARMMHVVNNLCAFLMFEVMETTWIALQEALEGATCLDDVIRAHDKYLTEIMDKALLAPQHEAINMQVQQVLQSILRFCSLEETLIADATASLARRRAARAQIDQRTKEGGWGVLNERALEDPPGSFDGVPSYVIERLDGCARDYGGQFDTLMNMLRDQGDQTEDILRFLTFRLDFNEYHALTHPAYRRAPSGAATSTAAAASSGSGGSGGSLPGTPGRGLSIPLTPGRAVGGGGGGGERGGGGGGGQLTRVATAAAAGATVNSAVVALAKSKAQSSATGGSASTGGSSAGTFPIPQKRSEAATPRRTDT